MTLNLPLADVIRLKPPLPTSPRSPVPLPVRNPRRRFLGLAATCRIYRGVLPHLVLLAAALARLVRPSPRHSFLVSFDDPLEIYCLPLAHPLFSFA